MRARDRPGASFCMLFGLFSRDANVFGMESVWFGFFYMKSQILGEIFGFDAKSVIPMICMRARDRPGASFCMLFGLFSRDANVIGVESVWFGIFYMKSQISGEIFDFDVESVIPMICMRARDRPGASFCMLFGLFSRDANVIDVESVWFGIFYMKSEIAQTPPPPVSYTHLTLPTKA